MKCFTQLCLVILSLSMLTACQENTATTTSKTIATDTNTTKAQVNDFAIVIHGGAGDIRAENLPDSLQEVYRQKLKEAVTAGYTILKNGGKAVEAVEASINVMENSPLFNAGKGAVLTHNERPSLDASVMLGKNLKAGAIAGVSHIKNPIDLAIAVMQNSKHVMLAGKGAEKFALTQGFDTVPESYFITQKRLRQVRHLKQRNNPSTAAVYYDPYIKAEKLGTVGCVALDRNGNIAAGTSTGGMTNKRYGRIGDSPIIGAGTYANNKTCGVSCTGWGEYYIRGVVAYDMSALLEYKGLSVSEAAHKIIHEKQPALGGSGGMIAIDHRGQIVTDFNTTGMFRAQMDDAGNLKIGMF